MDTRYMDLVWDKPTLFFQDVKRYLMKNKGAKDYGDISPVAKDGEIGKLVHNMFLNSYRLGQQPLSCATQYVNEFGLQLVREKNGKEKALLSRLWRIDLDPMSRWMEVFFSETPELCFNSPELDREDEMAKAYVWIGYDQVWADITTHSSEIRPERKLQGTNIDDCRVSCRDLSTVMDALKGERINLAYSQNFDGERPDDDSLIVGCEGLYEKQDVPLPVTYENMGFGKEDLRTQTLFAPYSVISIEGDPAEVRKTVFKLFAACSNESRRISSGIDKTDAINLDLECCLSSHHLLYHQWES